MHAFRLRKETEECLVGLLNFVFCLLAYALQCYFPFISRDKKERATGGGEVILKNYFVEGKLLCNSLHQYQPALLFSIGRDTSTILVGMPL